MPRGSVSTASRTRTSNTDDKDMMLLGAALDFGVVESLLKPTWGLTLTNKNDFDPSISREERIGKIVEGWQESCREAFMNSTRSGDIPVVYIKKGNGSFLDEGAQAAKTAAKNKCRSLKDRRVFNVLLGDDARYSITDKIALLNSTDADWTRATVQVQCTNAAYVYRAMDEVWALRKEGKWLSDQPVHYHIPPDQARLHGKRTVEWGGLMGCGFTPSRTTTDAQLADDNDDTASVLDLTDTLKPSSVYNYGEIKWRQLYEQVARLAESGHQRSLVVMLPDKMIHQQGKQEEEPDCVAIASSIFKARQDLRRHQTAADEAGPRATEVVVTTPSLFDRTCPGTAQRASMVPDSEHLAQLAARALAVMGASTSTMSNSSAADGAER